MAQFIEAVRRRLHELCADKAANVTATFALSTVPLLGFVGAAVDYSHANAVKASMQMAADSTALMISKSASTMTLTDMQTKADDYFRALFTRTDVGGLTVTTTYSTSNGSQIVIAASSQVKTSFMGLMGLSSLAVSVKSYVKWGNSRLRIALVLDNTGSMSSANKMTALKTATTNLLDQLKAVATTNGDVYVSIIPFAKDVNVGAGYVNASWIDWTEWDAKNGTCSKKPWSGTYKKKSDCEGAGGVWTPASRDTWNGCVVDRGGYSAPSALNTDTNVMQPDPAVPDTLFAAEQHSSCPEQVMPLSYDWTAMKLTVSNMTPSGNTNQAIGLAHGWLSLVGGGPYPPPPPEDPNYTYSKVIILLTDGLNTQNRWYSSQTAIDNREKKTCDNVKAAGITLYTVQVNTDGDPTSTLLKQCASSPDKFFLLTSANQIVATFQQIGTALSNLRIAQ